MFFHSTSSNGIASHQRPNWRSSFLRGNAQVELRPAGNGARIRPDGIQNFSHVGSLLDVGVCHPCTVTELKAKNPKPCSAMVKMVNDKVNHFSSLAIETGMTFTATIFETYGASSKGVSRFHNNVWQEAVANGLIDASTTTRARYLARLRQEISIELLKGNARIITQFRQRATKSYTKVAKRADALYTRYEMAVRNGEKGKRASEAFAAAVQLNARASLPL